MKSLSLKPETEFELLKLTVLRESYLKRLNRKLVNEKESIDISLVGLLDTIREISIQVANAVKLWQRTLLCYPQIKPFMWNKQNYLEKMGNDLDYLDSYDYIVEWLGFSLRNNPFIVPPELLVNDFELTSEAMIVFGKRPEWIGVPIPKRTKVSKFTKSPYLTPIVNDPILYPHLSEDYKLKKDLQRGEAYRSKMKIAQEVQKRNRDDPFETFLTFESVSAIREAWKILTDVSPHLLQIATTSFIREHEAFEDTTSHVLSPVQFTQTLDSKSTPFPMEDSTSFTQSPSRIDADTLAMKLPDHKSTELFQRSGETKTAWMERDNDALRLTDVQAHSSTLKEPGTFGGSLQKSLNTKVWSPHEIHLQKQVRRRGGELFVLTAAGTKGKMRTPWRRTRFERMETDLRHMNEQCEIVNMAIEDLTISATKIKTQTEKDEEINVVEGVKSGKRTKLQKISKQISDLLMIKNDVELRRNFLKYQFDHFQRVTSGSITNIEKQRKLRKLQEGQALEEDVQAAMRVEDEMAFRIQRQVRKAFGRAMRKAMLRKMNASALKIQIMWRHAQVHVKSKNREKQLNLALLLQRWYRGRQVGATMRQLRREAEERRASKTLQRVFRGYLGRRRLKLKRIFIKNIWAAAACVSLRELNPGHLEELADYIDMFVRDYTLDMPKAVLTVLRGVLYMFNGETSECVVVSKEGYIEKKYIRAATASWEAAKLVLRRKGRFLRRMRALIQNSSLPNPSQFVFTEDTVLHLQRMMEGLNDKDFESMTIGKTAALQLFHFCQHVKIAHDLQDRFPEYFDPGQPTWFRSLMRLRDEYDRSDIRRRIESKCKFRIEVHRRESTRRGKKWQHVAEAALINETALAEAKAARLKSKAKLEAKIVELEALEAKRLKVLRGIERAQKLGQEVSVGDLKEYIRASILVDEDRLRELQYTVDKKTLTLLQTRAEAVTTAETNERNKLMRDFDKLMNFKHLNDLCEELGTTLADLMILRIVWRQLLEEIGGEQYLQDLRGLQKFQYEDIKHRATTLIATRRRLIQEIEDELHNQYSVVLKFAYDLGMKAINQHWDTPTEIEVEAEEEENRECCRRDADFELRQKRQLEFVTIPSAPFFPALLLVDNRIPTKLQDFLVTRLGEFDFVLCEKSQTEADLIVAFQDLIDRKRHIIFRPYIGSDILSRVTFTSIMNSIISGLIPRPYVVALDATQDLRVPAWHTPVAVPQQSLLGLPSDPAAPTKPHITTGSQPHTLPDGQSNVHTSCDLLLAKIRGLSRMFRSLLLQKSNDQYPPGQDPALRPSYLNNIFAQDFLSFRKSVMLKKIGKRSVSSLPDGPFADVALAATLAGGLGLWDAPLGQWSDTDCFVGCRLFRETCKEISFNELCDMLDLKGFEKCDVIMGKRISRALELTRVWKYFEKLSFYENPARVILAQWTALFIEIVIRLSNLGGKAPFGFGGCSVDHVRHYRWHEDVYDEDAGEELVGELLYVSLHKSLIFELKDCPLKYYYDRKNLASTEQQCLGVLANAQHVSVYHSGEETYVGVTVRKDRKLSGLDVKEFKFFGRMKVNDIITMLQPNYTEIMEGKVKKIKLGEGGDATWFELLARWACLDNIGERFLISLIRTRFLILSKLGHSNGYLIRQEIFEERYGEVRILTYGILETGAVSFLVDRNELFHLMGHCDNYVEKDKLEALDAQAIAYIFSDRLEVHPPKKWQDFLSVSDLLPRDRRRASSVYMRQRRGPGRRVGHRLITVGNVELLMTIYEINNETNTHELRVLLYEPDRCQTVEYRISPMERLMLFKDDIALFDQIVQMLRAVYCDRSQRNRKLLYLDKKSFEPTYKEYEVEGDDQYDIRSYASSHAEDDDEKSVLTSVVESLEVGEAGIQRSENIEKSPVMSQAGARESTWGWAIYLHRGITSEQKGNLLISSTLNIPLKGFEFFILDQRTLREAYCHVSYPEACRVLADRSMESLETELGNVDESVAFDLVDDLMGQIDLQDSDEDKLALVLTNESSEEHVVLALLKERDLWNFTPDPLSKKRKLAPAHRIYINVHAAKNLYKPGPFSTRNPLCIVKWNFREIGRTKEVKNSTNPQYKGEEGSFHALTLKGQKLEECSLDIEIFDSETVTVDKIEKVLIKDFLGCVKLNGAALVDFLTNEQEEWIPLGGAKRMTDEENKNVKGSLQISGKKQISGSTPKHGDEEENDELTDFKQEQKTLKNIENSGSLEQGHTLEGENSMERLGSSELDNLEKGDKAFETNSMLDPIPLLDLTNEPPRKAITLSLCVLTVDGLPAGTDVEVAIKLNGYLAGTQRGTTGEGNFMQARAEFYQPPMELILPIGFPILGCSVEIEVYRIKGPKGGRPALSSKVGENKALLGHFGSTCLQGKFLESLAPSSAPTEGTWVDLVPPEGAVKEVAPPRLLFLASTGKLRPTKYKLHVLCAKGLPVADIFGLSDPYVEVYFNQKFVGKTKYQAKTLEPDWADTESFEMEVPPGRALKDCRLELEVYDHDTMTRGDHLGSRIVEKQSLVDLMTFDERNEGNKTDIHRGIFFELKQPHRKDIKQRVEVSGELKIRGEGIPKEEEEPDDNEPITDGIKMNNESMELINNSQEVGDTLEDDKTPVDENEHDGFENDSIVNPFDPLLKVQQMRPEKYVLSIMNARNLSKADFFGKSDPFVKVYFNGKYQGRTATIKKTLNPDWSEKEMFELVVPRGLQLEHTRLELEVLDEDSGSEGDFLGCRVIGGLELMKLLDYEAEKRGEKIFSKYYDLETSTKYTEKENHLVKGKIEIRLQKWEHVIESPTKAKYQDELDDDDDETQLPKKVFLRVEALHGISKTIFKDHHHHDDLHADVSVWWNGQEICRVVATYNKKEKILTMAEPGNFVLMVPAGMDPGECFLEIALWHRESPDKESCLGGIYFHGDALRTLLNSGIPDLEETSESLAKKSTQEIFSLISVAQEADETIEGEKALTKSFESSKMRSQKSVDSNSRSLALSASVDLKASFLNSLLTTHSAEIPPPSGDHWYPVHVSQAVPELLHETDSSKVVGFIQIRSLLVTGLPASSAEMSVGGGSSIAGLPHNAYRFIGTSLGSDSVDWGFYFPDEFPLESSNNSRVSEDRTKQNSVADEASVTTNSGEITGRYAWRRFLLKRSGEVEQWEAMVEPPVSVAMEESKELLIQLEGDEESEVSIQHRKLNYEKFRMELPAVNFVVTKEEAAQKEDHRVCWRGRVMPKNFYSEESTRKAILASRASRLLRTQSMNDMKVMAEVHYLVEYGDEEVVPDDLPVAVNEVLSEGPGLVTTTYRIDLSANNGVLMGSVEVKDSEDDIRRTAGAEFAEALGLHQDKRLWKKEKVFEHIVRERLVLDLLTGTVNKNKDGRREGIIQQHAENAEVSGSVVSVIRDKVDPKVLEELPTILEAPEEDKEEKSVEKSVAETEGKICWHRLHSRSQRLTGRNFLSLVLLQVSEIRAPPLFLKNPVEYFKITPGRTVLSELDLLFRCKDALEHRIYELRLPCPLILHWLPEDFFVDLKTKFRRAKFGAHLLQFLSLRFMESGSIDLLLVTLDKEDEEFEEEGEENEENQEEEEDKDERETVGSEVRVGTAASNTGSVPGSALASEQHQSRRNSRRFSMNSRRNSRRFSLSREMSFKEVGGSREMSFKGIPGIVLSREMSFQGQWVNQTGDMAL